MVNEKIYINFIDLETLGPARPGWDEGRNYVFFAMNSRRQEIFLELLKEEPVFRDEDSMMNFWRVVMLRCLREIYLLRTGKYDEPIEIHEKSTAKHDLKEK